MSSELSDHLCGWEGKSQHGHLMKPRVYVKGVEVGEDITKWFQKDHTYPIFKHCNFVCPSSRSEPMGDPDHGLDPFPGW